MADAVIGLLLDKLNSLIQREFGLFWGVEDDINKLSSLLSTIRAVLQDAETNQFVNNSVADWLIKLNETAYDAGNVLEEWLLTHTLDDPNALSCLSPNYMMFRRRIAKKVQTIITRFNDIAEERLKFHLSPNGVQTGFQLDGSQESSFFLTEVVFGTDDDGFKSFMGKGLF